MTAVQEAAPSPSIGIYWVVADGRQRVVLADTVPPAGGESYGDFLTHGAHYEYWRALAALNAGDLRRRGLPLAPLWSEYEEWPRGRVVFHIPSGRFVLYADRKLLAADRIELIRRRFGLVESSFDVRTDAHYRSVR